MLATLCFFYNDFGYYKIANFLHCYINPAFAVIYSLLLFSFSLRQYIILKHNNDQLYNTVDNCIQQY